MALIERELDIAVMICQSIPTRNISEQLSISYHTVRNHMKHIYSNTGILTCEELLTLEG